jgi:hypothetical protein
VANTGSVWTVGAAWGALALSGTQFAYGAYRGWRRRQAAGLGDIRRAVTSLRTRLDADHLGIADAMDVGEWRLHIAGLSDSAALTRTRNVAAALRAVVTALHDLQGRGRIWADIDFHEDGDPDPRLSPEWHMADAAFTAAAQVVVTKCDGALTVLTKRLRSAL